MKLRGADSAPLVDLDTDSVRARDQVDLTGVGRRRQGAQSLELKNERIGTVAAVVRCRDCSVGIRAADST